jgi:hypothetical protein
MKTFEELINNSGPSKGKYFVFITANRNNVAQWQTDSLENAELSIPVYLKERAQGLIRCKAKISLCKGVIKRRIKVQLDLELIKEIDL